MYLENLCKTISQSEEKIVPILWNPMCFNRRSEEDGPQAAEQKFDIGISYGLAMMGLGASAFNPIKGSSSSTLIVSTTKAIIKCSLHAWTHSNKYEQFPA